MNAKPGIGRDLKVGVLLLAMVILQSGCYGMRSNAGGADTEWTPPRQVSPADIALPEGYRIEAVASDLSFPTGVTFDEQGNAYVVESGYAYGEVWTTPRLLRIDAQGQTTIVAEGENNGPWTGVDFANGYFYVAEGGTLAGGRILRISPNGDIRVLLADLPGMGDHHTNGPRMGPDGSLYFLQGTATNSGVVGTDNHQFGWASRFPDFHDIPCRDIRLTQRTFETENPLEEGSTVVTGAFAPFGKQAGEVARGRIPCNGAVMRLSLQGGAPELVAWGLRNPFGLAFDARQRLFVSENGFDDRGSRPIWGAPDVLWEIKEGQWYGWPDFAAGQPVTHEAFHPPGKARPELLLAKHPQLPPKPTAQFAVHSSSNGFDFSHSPVFGYEGEAFVAQLGDETPTTGKLLKPSGFKVVRVDVGSGVITDFAVNRGEMSGPASLIGGGGLERPIAARFTPDGHALYVVDFGVMTHSDQQALPRLGTGVLWRITRESNAQ